MNSILTKPLRTIILAAGEGKRMKSDLPKVLHTLHNKPLIQWVWDAALQIGSEKIVIVVGHKRAMVMEAMKNTDAHFAIQWQQKGTGDAVLAAKKYIHHRFKGSVMVLSGDVPLISTKTLLKLRTVHEKTSAVATILTFRTPEPDSYGRIVRDDQGKIIRIVEAKDASEEELKIQEVNSGIYIFQAQWLWKELERLQPNNSQGEYYLTDVVKSAVDNGNIVSTIESLDPIEAEGVNTQEQLKSLEKIVSERFLKAND
ncbi:MAG: sugar phosphate nucleotidyltransferase [bacterium]|nr:sugar phosphate nucleotidyltransferase [bacterium]